MRKTELAAKQYQQLVRTARMPGSALKGVRREHAMNGQAILTAMLPEHLLLAGIVLLVVLEIVGSRRGALARCPSSRCAAAAASRSCCICPATPRRRSPGSSRSGPDAFLAKAIVLALAVPVLLMARDDFADDGPFYPLLLSSLYGFCLLLSPTASSRCSSASSSCRCRSTCWCCSRSAGRRAPRRRSSTWCWAARPPRLFLMGVSLLYGGSGSLALSAFAAALGSTDPMATAAVVLVLVAFFLKAAIVPFHAWAPDAYEGASVPVTAYMATIIKAGVLLAALRLFGDGAGVAARSSTSSPSCRWSRSSGATSPRCGRRASAA